MKEAPPLSKRHASILVALAVVADVGDKMRTFGLRFQLGTVSDSDVSIGLLSCSFFSGAKTAPVPRDFRKDYLFAPLNF